MLDFNKLYIRPYTAQEWRAAGILGISYLAAYLCAVHFVPAAAGLNPGLAVALAGLFFGGLRLWPMVVVAALVGGFFAQVPLVSLVVVPVAAVLAATAGAYWLRRAGVDPLFRRKRDMFGLIATVGVVSAIYPTLALVEGVPWGPTYVATLFCLLVLTPFILRWCAKPYFSRPPREVVETLGVFAVLVGINIALFIYGVQTVAGIPLPYFLFAPLFIIALRLRPRFITLAFVLTALCAVGGALANVGPGTLDAHLFQTELFLIVLTVSFFIVTSLEEDRRVNTNLARSQLGTLENMVARITSESRAKNEFIAILAHELRNPLAPVVSSIELLQLKGARDAEEATMLGMMADRMGTVRRLLDDLLDVSRISEGKMTINKKERVDLESAVKGAILSTEHHRRELHQKLVFKKPPQPLWVGGDWMQIEQIFSNLLTNASKYSNSGDTIALSMREVGGQAEVEVSDKGVGLERQALEVIFLPFHQVEQGERTKKGLGIGLSLVRDFVHMHGGTVVAHSEGSGRGSRFVVRLPLLPPEAA